MNNNATRPYKKQSQYARADSFVLGSRLIMKAIPYGLSQPGHSANGRRVFDQDDFLCNIGCATRKLVRQSTCMIFTR